MARRRRGRVVNGWIALDKPVGLTSTAAVAQLKRLFDAQKVGHAGTLDPLASGVLPIAFGEATKTVAHAMDGRKRYQFTIRWGESRSTDDAEGEVTATSTVRPARDAILSVLPRFTGTFDQVPPIYSAIKINGERAYDLARDGQTPALAPRPITIEALDLVDIPDTDHAVLAAVSGKGAYMRALARDIALALGTVGYMSALRRIAVGAFTLDDAVTLAHITDLSAQGLGDQALLPVAAPLDDIPAVVVSEGEAHRMRCGQTVALLRRSDRERLESLYRSPDTDQTMVLAVNDGVPVALAEVSGVELRPVRVLNLSRLRSNDVDHR